MQLGYIHVPWTDVDDSLFRMTMCSVRANVSIKYARI